MTPFVSVIVPCRNEAASLGAAWIRSCAPTIRAPHGGSGRRRRQRGRHRKLIDDYAAKDARVRRIDNPERITPVALNRAILAARGEIVMRLGRPRHHRRELHPLAVGYLESSGADNVGGSMRTLPRGAGPFAEPIRMVLTHRFGVGNSHFRTGDGFAALGRHGFRRLLAQGNLRPRGPVQRETGAQPGPRVQPAPAQGRWKDPAGAGHGNALLRARHAGRLLAAQLDQRRLGRAAVRLRRRDSGALAASGPAGLRDRVGRGPRSHARPCASSPWPYLLLNLAASPQAAWKERSLKSACSADRVRQPAPGLRSGKSLGSDPASGIADCQPAPESLETSKAD